MSKPRVFAVAYRLAPSMKSAILSVEEGDIQFARVVFVIMSLLLAQRQQAAQFKALPKPVEAANPEKSGQSRYSYGGLLYTGAALDSGPGSHQS